MHFSSFLSALFIGGSGRDIQSLCHAAHPAEPPSLYMLLLCTLMLLISVKAAGVPTLLSLYEIQKDAQSCIAFHLKEPEGHALSMYMLLTCNALLSNCQEPLDHTTKVRLSRMGVYIGLLQGGLQKIRRAQESHRTDIHLGLQGLTNTPRDITYRTHHRICHKSRSDGRRSSRRADYLHRRGRESSDRKGNQPHRRDTRARALHAREECQGDRRAFSTGAASSTEGMNHTTGRG